MAQLSLTEYIENLRLDGNSVNEATWYAKSKIVHGVTGKGAANTGPADTYTAGMPITGLKNREVADLLESNAITSVNPNKDAAANSEQAQVEQAQQTEQQKQEAAGTGPSGEGRVENPNGTGA